MMAMAFNNQNDHSRVPKEVNGSTFCDLMFTGNPKIVYPKRYKAHTDDIRKTYKCWYCPSVQYDFEEYKNHRNGHLNKFKFTCNECTFSSKKERLVTQHTKCHKPEYFKRRFANKRSDVNPKDINPREIKRAKLDAQKQAPSGRIEQPNLPKSKPAWPTSPRRYKCEDPKCPTQFYNLKDFEAHMLRHKISGKYRCHLCTYSARKDVYLQIHLKKHVNHENGRSLIPGQTQTPQTAFTTSAIAPPECPGTPIRLPDQKGFICPSPNCPVVSATAKDVRRHMHLHKTRPLGSFGCDLCSYAAVGHSAKHHLQNHKLMHEKNKKLIKFKAELGLAASEENQLATTSGILIRIPGSSHTGPRYKCPDKKCPQIFYKRSDALTHFDNLHKRNGKYKCDQCSFSTMQLYLIMKHKQKHSKNSNRPPLRQQPKADTPTLIQLSIPMKTSHYTHTNQPKIKAAVYRPTWFKKKNLRTRMDPNQPRRRMRRDLIKDGLVTPAELKVIREGNPAFTYETHRIYISGHRVPTNFRCFHCPKAFESFELWQTHQRVQRHEDHAEKTDCWVDVQRRDATTSNPPGHPGRLPPFTGGLGFAEDEGEESGFDETSAEEELESLPEENEETDYRLITLVGLRNFTKFQDESREGFQRMCLQGGNDCGKTSLIIACLIGMAYDLLLGLSENATLCGVPLSGILKHGASFGSVEISLQLKPYKKLLKKYGRKLKVKRYIFKDRPLSASEFTISYKTITEQVITTGEVQAIMAQILPTYDLRLLRLMVLNNENVDYFYQNWSDCNDMFWGMVDRQESELRLKLETKQDLFNNRQQIMDLTRSRIEFLKKNLGLGGSFEDLDLIRTLRGEQRECRESEEKKYALLEKELQSLGEEEVDLTEKLSCYFATLMNRMRILFEQYIRTHNYTGGILVSRSRRELVIWMKDIATLDRQMPEIITLEQARQIWRKELHGGRKRFAVTALFLALWQVLDNCPIMMADAFSTNETEFNLPLSTMPMLIEPIRQWENRQFIISVPGESQEEFVQKYASPSADQSTET